MQRVSYLSDFFRFRQHHINHFSSFLFIFSSFLLPFSFFLFTFSFTSCQSTLPPEKRYQNLKFTFNSLISDPAPNFIDDLNNDGKTERIRFIRGLGTPSFTIFSPTNEVILQEPFRKNLSFQTAFDLDGDGVKELIFWRNDEKDDRLWEVYNWKTASWKTYFILHRDSRCTIPDWDFGFRPFYLYDVNKDGIAEIIGVLATGYGKYPRGVGAYDLNTQSFSWIFEMGAAPSYETAPPLLANIDHDPQPELLLVTDALKNSAVANGLDDFHAYFLAIDLLTHQADYIDTLGGKSAKTVLKRLKNPDGSIYYLVNVHSDEVGGENFLRIYDFRLHVAREKRFNFNTCGQLFLTDFDGDILPDIFLSSRQNKVLVLNQQLDIITSKTFPFLIDYPVLMVDYNRDGRDEFLLKFINNIVLLLDRSLEPLGYLKDVYSISVFNSGEGDLQFAVGTKEGFSIRKVVRNWISYRWYFYSIPFFAVILFLTFIVIRLRNLFRFQRLINRYVAFHQNKGILIITHKGKILLLNHFFHEQFAHPHYQPINTIQDLWLFLQNHPQLRELGTHLSEAWKTVQFNFSQSIDRTITLGDKHYKLRVSGIKDGTKINAFLVEVEDITQIIYADRNRYKVAIMRNIAHDIKQPLTNILITMDNIRHRFEDLETPQINEFLYSANLVKEETQNVNDIIRNLLEFADIEKPRKTLTNLKEILEPLYLEYLQRMPQHITLHMEIANNLPDFYLDPKQIERAFRNVINNAIAAIDREGKIVISAQLAPKLSLEDPELVVVEITDNGCGIPAEHLSKIFDPYFTTKPSGTGLGMCIVYDIVEKHGGKIVIQSKVNHGTSVKIFFRVTNTLEVSGV